MPIVLVTILLPLVAGALLFALPREDRAVSRAVGTLVAAATFFTVLTAGDARVEFPLALAPVRIGLPLRCDANLFLARAAARARDRLRDRFD